MVVVTLAVLSYFVPARCFRVLFRDSNMIGALTLPG